LTPTQVKGHLSHTHSQKRVKLGSTIFEAALEKLDVIDDLPIIDTSVAVTPFQGLKISEAFHCIHYPNLLLKTSVIEKHIHKSHPKQKSWGKSYFEVTSCGFYKKTVVHERHHSQY
jgi:hypothetical protein